MPPSTASGSPTCLRRRSKRCSPSASWFACSLTGARPIPASSCTTQAAANCRPRCARSWISRGRPPSSELRSPDGAKRNPGFVPRAPAAPDYAPLHPGYGPTTRTEERTLLLRNPDTPVAQSGQYGLDVFRFQPGGRHQFVQLIERDIPSLLRQEHGFPHNLRPIHSALLKMGYLLYGMI